MNLPEHKIDPPLLVLSAPGSGASAVTAMLARGAGLDPGETFPPTSTHPLGSLDNVGLTEASRALLSALDRDATCPPTSFDPGKLDLSLLRSAIEGTGRLAVRKAPALAYLLPALASAGLATARLLIVIRSAPDTVASISQRSGIPEFDAEAIVDAYHRRLASIAKRFDVSVVEFTADGHALIDQLARIAMQLDTEWDPDLGLTAFDESLIVNRSSHPGRSKSLTEIMLSDSGQLELTTLASCTDLAGPAWPLSLHAGPQRDSRAAAMWNLASRAEGLVNVEISTRKSPSRYRIAGHGSPVRISAFKLEAIASNLVNEGLRPDRLVLPGWLDAEPVESVAVALAELHQITPLFAEVVVDLVETAPSTTSTIEPTAPPTIGAEALRVIAEDTGWGLREIVRISTERVAVRLRRRTFQDPQGKPDARELRLQLEALEAIVSSLQTERPPFVTDQPIGDAVQDARRRAERAEEALQQLMANPVIRTVEYLARPVRRLRTVVLRLRRALGR